jgi:hypothetical protein
MKEYYERNKEQWNRYREDSQTRNAKRRERYATNAAEREKCKANAKNYRLQKPMQRRKAEIKKLYGLEMAEYQNMLDAQDHKCAICIKPFRKTPNVDHCHDTGRVRGLLCFNCNRAIGHLQNDTGIIQNAIAYLQRE